MIIDCHTHAFPDALAQRAVSSLAAAAGDAKPALNGTIADLLRSMDTHGIAVSVVACIATRPAQFQPILDWCRAIASDRLVPFPSVHPDDPDALARVKAIAAAGFRGVKLHPYYQQFSLDEPRVLPLFQRIAELGLPVLCHTGFDIAYPRDRICDPVRIAGLLDRVPTLRFIASHVGAWEDWDEVERHLLGRAVYLDTAYSHAYLGPARMRDLLLRHPAEFVLFGSDSPWDDQGAALAELRAMRLPPDREGALFAHNARRLLGL
jgi:predicted TIM-barrel fold metal-dependent hydrolase